MDITITPSNVSDDIKNIETTVAELGEAMDNLDKKLLEVVSDEVQTEWAERFYEDWKGFYQNEVPTIKGDMNKSAQNLQSAINSWYVMNAGKAGGSDAFNN